MMCIIMKNLQGHPVAIQFPCGYPLSLPAFPQKARQIAGPFVGNMEL